MKRTRCHNLSHRLSIGLMLWLCIFLVHSLTAQETAERYADSLLTHARQAGTNELKIEGLLNVSIFWSDRDTAKAYRYLREARQLMGKSPSDFQMGLYHLYRGNIIMEYNTEKAKSTFRTADSLLAVDTSPKSYRYRSKLWNNYGIILQMEDRGDEFMKLIVNKTLPYARLAGDSAAVGYQLHNMALQLGNIHDYAKAADYYEAALHTLRNLSGLDDNKFEVFSNAARNAIFRRKFDLAKIYLDSAEKILPRVQFSTFVPTFYRTELVYYRYTKNARAVMESYRKGIAAAKKLEDDYMLNDLNRELHLFYRERGEYEKAKEHLMLSRKNKPFTNASNLAIYYKNRADIEYHLNNYKSAYLYMDSLNVTQDSIFEKGMASKVLTLEQQYKATEKENQILRLEAANRQQELRISRTRWWVLTLGGGLLLTLCVAVFSWKIGKNNKKLLAQKELLHQEELRSLRQQERLRQYDAMLQGQETERSRLAKDLHDGLGGLLAGVKLKLSSIVAKTGGSTSANRGAVEDVIHQLDYSVDELRRIAHNMMPESLHYGGLVPALSDLCRYMGTPQVQVAFQDLGLKDSYPEQLRITLYRIVQELLTNALKHAEASKVILQCSELGSWLFVTVEDNGKGMDLTKADQVKGLGLINIQNRVSLLNGHIETLSQYGEGTTINIQVPYNGEQTN